MFATSINFLHSINKRAIVTILTVLVLSVAMFAATPGISHAGDATSPSACGTCSR